MNESKTDPLSGLPQPNQGIKPSPLKDAGSVNESKGERWWLSDSVQPNELISEQPTHTEVVETTEGQPIDVSTATAPEAEVVEADISASRNDHRHVDEEESISEDDSSSGNSGLNLLIGAGLLGLVLCLIFYGV